MLIGCGIFDKKDNGDEGGVFQPNQLAVNNYESFSETPYNGTRDEALAIASQKKLNSNFDVIQAGTLQVGNNLLSLFGNETYDQMTTHTWVHDPSLSMLKTVRSMLCILTKVQYTNIPKTKQKVSAKIKACLPQASSKGQSGSGGQQGGGGQQQSGKKDDGLAVITWEAFVNVESQLIVKMQYTEQSSNSFMPSMDKQITFVINEGSSDTNPFGSYYLKILGYASGMGIGGGMNQDGMTSIPLSLDNMVENQQWANFRGSMIIESGNRVGMAPDEVLINYTDTNYAFGNSKRMAGVFKLDTTDGPRKGSMLNGSYTADIEGWDEESGEPGGQFYVAFNGDFLLREKKIANPQDYFGPEWQGNINTEPITECYASNSFTNNVGGYRMFLPNGQPAENIDNSLFLTTSTDMQTAIQGSASYWGVDFFSFDGSPVELTNGMEVWAVDLSSYDTEGNPKLGAKYTIQVKPGRLSKNTRSNYSLSKIIGKELEGYWPPNNNDNKYSYKVRYEADQKFYVIARRENTSWESTSMSTWEDLTPYEATIEQGSQQYLWSPSLSGSIIISNNGGSITAYMDVWEPLKSNSSIDVVCYQTCPVGGTLTADDLQNPGNGNKYYQNTYSSPRNYRISNFVLTDLTNNQTVNVDFSGASSDNFYTLWVGDLILKSDWDTHYSVENNITDGWTIRQLVNTTYSYDMGKETWAKTVLLYDSNNQLVTFKKPLSFELTLTAENERFGETKNLGKTFDLHADFGRLHVPMEPSGKITDPITGETFENWSAIFALKDGTTITADNSTYKIKAEFIERRMNAADLAQCNGLQLPYQLGLPEKVVTPMLNLAD